LLALVECIDAVKDLFRLVVEQPAGLGQLHPLAVARKEFNPERSLELLDMQ